MFLIPFKLSGFTCFIHHGSCSCSDQCACLPPLQYVELKIWHPQVLERISKESIKSPACISKLDPSPNEHAMKVFNSAGTPFSDHACYFIAFLCSFLRIPIDTNTHVCMNVYTYTYKIKLGFR
ncbi:unnamed protein product [Musa acuminata subsp. malaccensis]|uniref:(wild Malaysian banana) hypothetical protein n=1 Tax=Musa acuminata subsp. malaccensis TaxID=214687 RepID=A0A804I665_MUSAM|nr:unnamed protein product [Musa acuminata subsp. malaccensis]